MPYVLLDGAAITDWQTFHSECQRVFGFPTFYGRNMDAWIDCMSSLRDDDGMVGVMLEPGERLELEVRQAEERSRRLPDVMLALVECTAFVNQRYEDAGEPPAIALVLT